jgi:hypothetical protein
LLNPGTIGFRLLSNPELYSKNAKKDVSTTLKDQLMSFVNLYTQAETLISQHMNTEYHRGIELHTGDITTFSFKKLSDEEKKLLNKVSEKAVSAFFKKEIREETEEKKTTFFKNGNENTSFTFFENDNKKRKDRENSTDIDFQQGNEKKQKTKHRDAIEEEEIDANANEKNTDERGKNTKKF